MGYLYIWATLQKQNALVRQGWPWPYPLLSKVKPYSPPARAERGIFNLGVGLHRGSGILWGVL